MSELSKLVRLKIGEASKEEVCQKTTKNVRLSEVKDEAQFTYDGKLYMRSRTVSLDRKVLCFPIVVRIVWKSQGEWMSPFTYVTVEQEAGRGPRLAE